MKILIINSHPSSTSFCDALSENYKKGATEAGHHVEELVLRKLKFNPNLENGFSKESELEPDLKMAQEKIKEANHIVFVHPVWWGSVPALLKAFIDRTFLPGFAFKYKKDSPWWDKLLSGKSGEIIYTADTPLFFYKYFFGAPSVNQLKKRTMYFCGIKPVKVTGFAPIRNSTESQRKIWLEKIRNKARAL